MNILVTGGLGSIGSHTCVELARAGYQPVAGDIAACYANPALAERELGWSAQRGIAQMCADTWRWRSQGAGRAAGGQP